MASVEEIAIKFGLKPGDVKAGLADLGVDIKKFKKAGESTEDDGLLGTMKKLKRSVNDFKDLLVAGGIGTAVVNFFQLAIDTANKSTDATDESARAVREFGKGVDEAKGVLGTFAVTAVGAFNKLGSAIGDGINILRSFIQNGRKGFEVWASLEDAVAATSKAAEEAEARLAAVRKKNGAEFLQITKDLENVAKRREELALQGITTQETALNLDLKLFELLIKRANAENDAITNRRLALQIAETQLSLDQANLALKKEAAAESKKAAEDEKKAQDDYIKAAAERKQSLALDNAQEIELFTLRKKNVATLTADERVRLAVLVQQKEEKGRQVEMDDLAKKLIEDGLTPAEEKRLAELVKQKKKIDEQRDALGEVKTATDTVTDSTEKTVKSAAQIKEELRKAAVELRGLAGEWENLEVAIRRTGKAYEAQSLAALEGVRDRLRSQAQQMQNDTSFQSVFSPNAKNPLLYGIQSELAAVEKELSQRKAVTDTVSRFGEDAARRQYGDTLTDAGMRDLQDSAKRTSVAVENIANAIKNSVVFQAR